MQTVENQVIEFFDRLFADLFYQPFIAVLDQPIKRKEVRRQVEAAADAASGSLTRFLDNEKLDEEEAGQVLATCQKLPEHLSLQTLTESRVEAEVLADTVLTDLPCPVSLVDNQRETVFRVALHSVVQTLTLVGPIVAQWHTLNFSGEFEWLKRTTEKINQITEHLSPRSGPSREAVDEGFELSYRDYLSQRFFLVEAGTIGMTVNIGINIRELFVMPRTRLIPERDYANPDQQESLMDLARAKEGMEKSDQQADESILAGELPEKFARSMIIGPPGSGKSTFMEWLQLGLASVELLLPLNGRQAIPLLLRVRQLDPHDLPTGASLIEKATNSADRAKLMPPGWLDRQMGNGCILFMLDGLDETSLELRERYLLPWFKELCTRYPDCRYLVSSRPTGYSQGSLLKLEFKELELIDFCDDQIREYTSHWCTAVRLARQEREEEARREGKKDGDKIMDGFSEHAHIRHLARNPLMLSAICLVNYFEGGELPRDRAILYKLCVEGLLHHWDQRRGIFSEFSLTEKLRTCREVALAMQSQNLAECPAPEISTIMSEVLCDSRRTLPVASVEVTRRTLPALAEQPGVLAILPNQKINLIQPKQVHYETLAKNEIKDGLTWGLKSMDIPGIWQTTRGKDINVAVLDTGVHGEHPALGDRVKEFVIVDPLGRRIQASSSFDAGQHGTHVCGTIAGGKTPDGVAIGVAPEANLLVGGVLVGQSTLRTLLEGISWAIEKGADIINMSLGFTYYEPLFTEIFDLLIEHYGILPVVAIGNENHGNSSSPGSAYNALSAGAIEKNKNSFEVASFSSGASLVFPGEDQEMVTKPDLVAPGVQTYSCIPPEKGPKGLFEYTYMDGTSMATPHVAGVAALLMAAKPMAPVMEITEALKSTAKHPNGVKFRPDNRWGYGIIQPGEALKVL